MEAYLDGQEPDEATIVACLRKGTVAGKLVPVICGSAFKNKGVQPLLDAVVDFLPSPLEVPPTEGMVPGTDEMVVREPKDTAPMSGLAFKIMNDPFVGSLTFVRIYSGKIESGSYLQNTVKDQRERIGRILLMHANNREEIKEAFAGDIVALVGLKNTTTGDTLCDAAKPVILERMEFPEPVIEVAVEPRSKADQEKMGVALSRLAAEDPSFRVGSDPGVGPDRDQGDGRAPSRDHRRPHEARVQGRGQCRRAAGGLPRDHHQARRGRLHPQEAERRLGPVRAGEAGLRARARRAPGFKFEPRSSAARCPKEYIPGVEKGLNSAVQNGIIAGFPMVDLVAQLVDGAYHEVDSSALAFEIASRAAFKEGIAKAGPQLLEPVMRVEVVTPEDYMGDIIGDLNSRRGQITGMEPRGNGQVINAMVPLATMFGYVNTLRSLSQGRAQFTMHFDHYEPVPQMVAEEIRAKYA